MIDTLKLGKHAAVQLERGEVPHDIARLMLNKLKACRFHGLEILGLVKVGACTFVRFRTDAETLPKVLEEISATRGVIRENLGIYKVYLLDGRVSTIASSLLLAVSTPNEKKSYKGTVYKDWERQVA